MNSLISTKATFFRNVKDYKFSHKLKLEQKQEIINKLLEILGSDYSLLEISSLDEKVFNYLNENSLINKNTTTIILNKNQSICIDLFNGEHLSIVASGDNSFTEANKLADLIQNKISLSYSDEYGYLMTNLNNVGAGVKLECDICLDAICGINKLEQVKQNVAMLGYSLNATNVQNCFRISTKCSLGFSEQEIYDNFIKTINKLQDLEVESVKMLDITKHDEILDNVNRSLAILNVAHMINVEELTRHIIILRTGLNLGVADIEINKINNLQKLVVNKINYATKEECIELAKKVRAIVKGENNV